MVFSPLLLSFFLYIGLLFAIAAFFYRTHKKASDFMTGSQSVNYWVTAIATHATDMSTWLFMAFPGAVFRGGVPVCWDAVGLTLGIWLTWEFIAPGLRAATGRLKSLTLSSYFEDHFQDHSGAIRIVTALMALIFFTGYISAGVVGLGRALDATFGLGYHTSMIAGAVSVAIYALAGGFAAIAWNNFIQGMFILVVMLVVPTYAYFYVGGSTVIAEAIRAKGASLSLMPQSFSSVFESIAWGLGYFGQPHILVNFMGLDKTSNIKRARYVGMAWHIISISAAACIALIAIAFFQGQAVNSELIFVEMVKQLFPEALAGLILCAIFAAATSTMDSQILVASSTVAEDLSRLVCKKELTSTQKIFISRIAGLIITGIACFIGWSNSKTILDLVYHAWSGLGASFGPVVLASIYSRYINAAGACAGIAAGGFVVGIWPVLGINFNAPLLIGFIANFTAMYLVTWISKKS